MSQKILVTGATGKIGSELVKLIASNNLPARIAVRDIEKLGIKANENLDIVNFSFENRHLYEEIFKDVDKLFLLVPSLHSSFNDIIERMVHQAKLAEVKKVVFVSAMGTEDADESELLQAEMHISFSGLNYIFLRPNWFMQNFNTYYLKDIKEKGKLMLPCGDAPISFIDTRDIAKAAFGALLKDNLNNIGVTLTGPDSLNFEDVAEILSNAIGKKIEYESISDEHYKELLVEQGYDKTSARSMVWLYQAVRRGEAAPVSNNILKMGDIDRIDFKTYANDYRNYWL